MAKNIKDTAEAKKFIADAETMERVKRIRVLNDRIKRDEAEKKILVDELKKDMSDMEVYQFTDAHGVVAVTLSEASRKTFDRTYAEKVLGAKILEPFYNESLVKTLKVS